MPELPSSVHFLSFHAIESPLANKNFLTVSVSLAVDVSLLALAVVAAAVGSLDDTGGATGPVVVVVTRLGGLGPVEEHEEEDHGEGGEGEGADGLGHGGSGVGSVNGKRV